MFPMPDLITGYQPGVVNLTNAGVLDTDSSPGAKSASAGVRINSDGTVDKQVGGVYTQIGTLTDWIIPNAGSAATFYIRATEVSFTENETNPTVFSTKNGTMSSWITVGGGQSREWSLDGSTNTAGEGDNEWVIDLEIARDSGGVQVLTTGRFTFQNFLSAGGP